MCGNKKKVPLWWESSMYLSQTKRRHTHMKAESHTHTHTHHVHHTHHTHTPHTHATPHTHIHTHKLQKIEKALTHFSNARWLLLPPMGLNRFFNVFFKKKPLREGQNEHTTLSAFTSSASKQRNGKRVPDRDSKFLQSKRHLCPLHKRISGLCIYKLL